VLIAILCAAPLGLRAQSFKLFDRNFQVHGFASQGFIYTNENNWLTMNTSVGSASFTDFGVNITVPITDKFRVGAQLYDRNLGQLGNWHPSLDWAYASYKFKPWFAIRGGKIKTTLGLFTETQDLDFLRVFALLPQSVYPIDLRDSTISHEGGDVYGDIRLRNKLGVVSYTVYAGYRHDSMNSGYPYDLKNLGVILTSYGGLQYGGDLRWQTPLKGLLVGMSRLDQDITGDGHVLANPRSPAGVWHEYSNSDWTNQFYGQYARGKWEISSEWHRYWRDQQVFNGLFSFQTDVRGSYASVTYRATKWLGAGAYYSHYRITIDPTSLGPGATGATNDRAISARFDLNRFTNIKVEGHFMAGVGSPGSYPDGFYLLVNPQGLNPNTAAFVLKVGFTF
jgi:hypothetical protein